MAGQVILLPTWAFVRSRFERSMLRGALFTFPAPAELAQHSLSLCRLCAAELMYPLSQVASLIRRH